MALNLDLAGKDYGTFDYEVTADAIEEYARATNDENDRYMGDDDIVAPPVFPVVPAFPSYTKAGFDPDLQVNLMRLVHGEEEHIIHRPIRPGDVLTCHAVLEDVQHKETGETFTVKVTESAKDGELVAEVRGTMFIRGAKSKDKGEAQEEPQRDIVYEETTKVDDDQTFRYAAVAGDPNPIHVDENTARMAGLPGIILHGMCTMAMATKGAVNGLAGGDPTRIKRVAVRLSKPARPGQELTTKFWKESESDGVTTYGFETYNPEGAAVIKNAVVEIAG